MPPAAPADQPPAVVKASVRAGLRERRRALVADRDRAVDAEDIALAGLHAAYAAGLAPGDWVAAYESTPLEPPTEALVAALSARGIRVMVPVTLADWDLDWREVGSDATLGLEAIGWARVVFLPAHGVDTAGSRIGQGRGCYDRVLLRTQATLVAVVHPWEVLDRPLPIEPHDQPVDAVIAAGHGYRTIDSLDT